MATIFPLVIVKAKTTRGCPPAGIGAAEPEPGVLHGVLGLAHRAEQAVGHRPQVGAALLKSLGQPVVFVHLSHSSVAFGHSSDDRNGADVAGGSAPVDSVDTAMVSIRVQRRHLKTPGGEQPCKHG